MRKRNCDKLSNSKNKILLHICCAPCSIYPIDFIADKGFFVMGYFYKDNIHPYTEMIKREKTLDEYAKKIGLKIIKKDEYNMEGFLRNMVFRESHRCSVCYYERLKSAAKIAKKGKFDYFSTTLLYSKFQNHDLIKNIGESIGKEEGIRFYYHDFREGWRFGIEKSKELNMYRQQYCGCIYSEKKRFCKI
jgi:epoxyqueuosine reductase